MNNLKKIIPAFLITIFIFLLYSYYQKNVSDFEFVKNINLNLILIVITLCFLYLTTEGLVLKNIVISLNKNISLKESFFVMNSTYFCNTFIETYIIPNSIKRSSGRNLSLNPNVCT